jgi:hypothetical protein
MRHPGQEDTHNAGMGWNKCLGICHQWSDYVLWLEDDWHLDEVSKSARQGWSALAGISACTRGEDVRHCLRLSSNPSGWETLRTVSQ